MDMHIDMKMERSKTIPLSLCTHLHGLVDLFTFLSSYRSKAKSGHFI